jgi:GNAT superfamily N-acetyltransferase
MPDIAIHDLADFPQWLPKISAWLHQEWRTLFGEHTVSQVEARLAGMMARDVIPAVLVAVADGEQVIGTLILKEQAVDPRASTPCVTGLFVLPQYRRRGIGAQLLRAAENKARDIGHSKLYLMTQTPQPLYDVHGWTRYKEASLYATQVTVMEKWLTPQSLFQPCPKSLRG